MLYYLQEHGRQISRGLLVRHRHSHVEASGHVMTNFGGDLMLLTHLADVTCNRDALTTDPKVHIKSFSLNTFVSSVGLT